MVVEGGMCVFKSSAGLSEAKGWGEVGLRNMWSKGWR